MVPNTMHSQNSSSLPVLKRKQIISAMVGNALEYYDVTLYGFFVPILVLLFYSSEDLNTQRLMAFGSFAAGFLMRPLGGLFFGHLGDKYGRRKALIVSITLVIFPTLIIGLLPTYKTIGMAAPIILVCCRLLQGLCVGGEYAGAAIFVVEHTHQRGSSGFWGSILISAGTTGAFCASLIGLLATLSFMPSWGWRLPFLLGALLGIVFLYMRLSLEETPVFQKLIKIEKTVKTPILEVLCHHKRNFLCIAATGAVNIIPLYIATTYLSFVLVKELEAAQWKTMLGNTMVMGISVFLIPVAGRLSDKWGTRRIMSLSSLGFIFFSFPIFQLTLAPTVTKIFIVQILLTVMGAFFVGPSAKFGSTLFPTQDRYSATAFGYGLGGAFLGGTSPLFCAKLVDWFDDPRAVSLYLMCAGIVGALALFFSRPLKGEDLGAQEMAVR